MILLPGPSEFCAFHCLLIVIGNWISHQVEVIYCAHLSGSVQSMTTIFFRCWLCGQVTLHDQRENIRIRLDGKNSPRWRNMTKWLTLLFAEHLLKTCCDALKKVQFPLCKNQSLLFVFYLALDILLLCSHFSKIAPKGPKIWILVFLQLQQEIGWDWVHFEKHQQQIISMERCKTNNLTKRHPFFFRKYSLLTVFELFQVREYCRQAQGILTAKCSDYFFLLSQIRL